MIRYYSILFVLFILISCNKAGKEKQCPKIANESVPADVIESLKDRYPSATVEAWFNKDDRAFTAFFHIKGTGIFCEYTPDGKLLKEQLGDDEDNSDGGCECEMENAD
jgi:hypothetical protein